MKEFIEYITKNLVDKPDQVVVSEEMHDNAVVYTLKVADDDIGKVIGKRGQTATALRILTAAVNKKAGRKGKLKILEKNESPSSTNVQPQQ